MPVTTEMVGVQFEYCIMVHHRALVHSPENTIKNALYIPKYPHCLSNIVCRCSSAHV